MDTIVSPRTLSVHKEHEFLAKLEAAGLDADLAQKVIGSKDNALGAKVIRLIANGGFEPSTSQKRAREIMGRNFFGVEEAIKHFGLSPSNPQLAFFSEVPFSEAILETSKDTHVLVAVFPLSILEIRGKIGKHFYRQDWYNNQLFVRDKSDLGWYLVRKTPVERSTSKNWGEQQAPLSKDEETPKAQVMVYTIVGHFLATGERLFEKIWVRCSDLDSDGLRVVVGHFDTVGLHVLSYRWDDVLSFSLGVASARKSV